MSLPTTDDEIRNLFARVRRLVQHTGPPNAITCQAEEDLVALAQRQRRVPSALVTANGYPSGGSNEGRSSDRTSITERAALTELDNADDEDHQPDPVGASFLLALHNLDMTAHTATVALSKITAAKNQSAIRKPLARTAEVCSEEGCTALAVTTDKARHPGRCEADRKWLEREADRAQRDGRDPIRAVPRAVIDQRDNPPRRHEHEHDDDIVSRLVSGYDVA